MSSIYLFLSTTVELHFSSVFVTSTRAQWLDTTFFISTLSYLSKTATGTQVPLTSGKTDFQKTMFLPLTMRCTLEITNFKSCPPTEHKGRFTVHSTDVKARIVYIHRIQNQLWRITMGNLNYRWTKKYLNLDWFIPNQDQTLEYLFQCS